MPGTRPGMTMGTKSLNRDMAENNRLLNFVARLCLVLIFPFSALDKIFNHASAIAQAKTGWVPLPDSAAEILLVLGGMLEVIGPSVFCSAFIADKRRCCSFSMSLSPRSCSIISGAFRSTASPGRKIFGHSSRISASPGDFSTSPRTLACSRCAKPSR
jgi:hypothetical protein